MLTFAVESAEREGAVVGRLFLQTLLKLCEEVRVYDVFVQDTLRFKVDEVGAKDAVEADFVQSQDGGRDVSLHSKLVFSKNLICKMCPELIVIHIKSSTA